jgi:hypothetical protein
MQNEKCKLDTPKSPPKANEQETIAKWKMGNEKCKIS